MTPAFPARPLRRLRIVVSRLRRRLKARPDSEHEMSINRLVFACLWIIGLAVAAGQGVESELLLRTFWAAAVYLAFGVGIVWHILARPGVDVRRRVFAMVADFSVISYGAYVEGEAAGWLYPLYLWTVFGNGFRFGLPYLHGAMALAIAGFIAAVTLAGHWRDHTGVVVALLIGLVILPLYAGVLIRKLSEAKKHAEEASRAKSLFLASVSHELRTPLNAIIGFSDLLGRSRLDRAEGEMVRTIATSARSLLGLINGLLDFTRLEAGRMPVNRAPFDLPALMRRVVVMLSVEACRKGLRLSFHVGADVPARIVGDERHLEEVLVNLASNAVKFTAEGHVLIAVELAARSPDGQVRLVFDISDSGIGIAPEAQSRIFESFTQADETIIDRFGGTGLGLAIVRQLVEMMGGRVRLRSAPGQGSTFTFDAVFGAAPPVEGAAHDGPVLLVTADAGLAEQVRALHAATLDVATLEEAADILSAETAAGNRLPPVLVDEEIGDGEAFAAAIARLSAFADAAVLVSIRPRTGAAALTDGLRSRIPARLSRPVRAQALAAALAVADPPGAAGDEAPAVRPAQRSLRVLVAEDNRTNQLVIGKLLETAGHSFVAVNDGEEAIDALRGGGFDIVLMDVNMPVMNGIEATKLYRFMSLGQPRVPIVALTADATAEARSRCLEAGMDACATKPIDYDRLMDVIDTTIRGVAPHPARETARDLGQRLAGVVAAPVLDAEKLAELEALGGKGFVEELVDEFLVESDRLVRDLSDAVADENVTAFREAAHALRSSAANVGAGAIFELCLGWRQTDARALVTEGEDRVRVMVDELEKARRALAERMEPERRAG